MQTFLPYADFQRTAKVLDYRRLGKQRIEAKQILRVLLNETDSRGWRNHPAVKMWKGHEGVLAAYGVVICEEWVLRGYKDNQLPYFIARTFSDAEPSWMGDEKFHVAHQSNLIRKDSKYYQPHFSNVKDDLPYIWPTSS